MVAKSPQPRRKPILQVAFFAILFACFFCGCESHEIIVENLSQSDANEILVILQENGIEAKKIANANRKETSYSLQVDESDVKDALAILVHNQFPKERSFGLKEVFPPGSSGIIPTKSDEQARLIMATQGEVEQMINLLPGVLKSRVVIASDDSAAFNKFPAQKSASVAILFRPFKDSQKASFSDQEITNLVTSAIFGLAPENISVLIKKAGKIDYSLREDQIPKAALSKTPNSFVNKTLYILVTITSLSLLLAAYAMVRLFSQSRKKKLPVAAKA